MRSRRSSGILAFFGLALLAGGCASRGQAEKLAFTDGLAGEYQLDAEHRRALQYYVSDTIRLVRSASGGDRGIRDGRLVSSASRSVEEVVIGGGTPGVVLASGPHWMAVSFEPGSWLYFVSDAPRAVWLGNEYAADRYYLYLPDFNGQDGTVRLGNRLYSATGDSYRAHLIVDRESFQELRTRQARLPGRVLGQR